MRLLYILAIAILTASVCTVLPAQAQSSQPPPIPVYSAWPKPHLSVVIYPNSSLSWYSTALLVNTSRAIQYWHDVLGRFADMYPRYSYLGQLQFSVYVAGVNDSSVTPDVAVRFVEEGDLPYGAIANTRMTWSMSDSSMEEALTRLGPQGNEFAGVVMHAFGLALGLGEPPTGSPYDLMMTSRPLSVAYPSTADLYALAYKYQWLQSGSYFHVSNYTVSLPSSIPYEQVVPYQVQLGLAEQQISSLTVSLASSDAASSQLRSQISSVDATLSSVRQQLASSRDNNTALASQLDQESRQLAALQSALDQKSAEAQQLVYWKLSTIVLVAALAVTIVVTRRRVKIG